MCFSFPSGLYKIHMKISLINGSVILIFIILSNPTAPVPDQSMYAFNYFCFQLVIKRIIHESRKKSKTCA